LVASEPDIRKPMNLAFDDRGRLWVTDTVEYPFPVGPEGTPRDSVKILEDFQEDGRAARVTTFADQLNIPIGVLPLGNGALVHSIPNIYRLSDTSGKGQADRRHVLYGSFGFKDTHGMTSAFTWGFDGWIYACHGYANTSEVRGADGTAITMHSGNVYRIRPDGSHIEYFTHGQVNPFGLAFDPLGNLYSCDCHSRPLYLLLRGAYYPSFGKPHDGLGFGPEMMSHDHGSTAIAGITYYAADHFPPSYRDTLFVGNVVTNRINHDRLERQGSTFRAIRQPDFLTSDDPWFRPVDLKLGPDGALYVADFYNRIIGHYEVPLTHPGRDRERGRIWRIVYRGPDGQGKPVWPRTDWTRATVEELVRDLAHPNLVVRMKAANQLVEQGGQAVVVAVQKTMRRPANPWQRVHGLWVLNRLGALDDRTLKAAATDQVSAVRVHAQRVLADRRELAVAHRRLVLAGLKDSDALVRRVAAEALALHPWPDNLRPLLDLHHQVPAADTHLLHTVRMALRNQLLAPEAWARLPFSLGNEADARAVADVAPGVPRAEAADYLLQHVRRWPEGHERLAGYVRHIARYAAETSPAALLRFVRENKESDLGHQAALFKALHQGTQERGARLSQEAQTWGRELTGQLLDSGADPQVLAGIELAGLLQLRGFQSNLIVLAINKLVPEGQRQAAVAALTAIDPGGHIPLLGYLLGDATDSVTFREQLAQRLAGLNRPDARAELIKALPVAPARLQTAIAVGLASHPAGAEKLLEAVAAGKASARLLQERAVEVRLQGTNLPGLKERLVKLTEGLPPVERRLQQLFTQRRDGFRAAKPDLDLGLKLFEKNCANCHQLGGKGAKVGPQLDGIGLRGLDRLLEDMLDPNRNIDQAFRATTLALRNGQSLMGLVLREEGEVVILADSQGKELRVPKGEIEDRAVSPLSPMPANLVDQIPEADFYHLLAFLLAQQPARGNQAP
jgi:putative heme-binding domain-containing protein